MSVIFNAVAMLEAILTGSAYAYKILRCDLASYAESLAASTDFSSSVRCERVDVELALKSLRFSSKWRAASFEQVTYGVEKRSEKFVVHGLQEGRHRRGTPAW